MSNIRKVLLIFATLVSTSLAGFVSFSADTTEQQVKAAMLFNFARFAEWPETAFHSPKTPISFCVIKDNPIRTLLKQTLSDKSIQGRSTAVLNLSENQAPKQCQVLFVAKNEEDDFMRLKPSLQGLPILTIGESDGFLKMGGVIRFYLADNKIRFEVNQSASRQAGIQLSSKLLSLGGSR